MKKIHRLSDVVDWRLCIGCGGCAYICPDGRVQLFDFFAEGIRPVVQGNDCSGCDQCLEVCPAVQSGLPSKGHDHLGEDFFSAASGVPPMAGPQPASRGPAQARSKHRHLESSSIPIDNLEKEWGQIVAIWEGYATDSKIRFKGSSGGALTAIGAYCIEKLGMHGVLHIAQDPDDPIRNRTCLSRTREQLLEATGSRYSPASVCNGLHLIEAAPAPCVVIGKPTEIEAVRNARILRPALDRKVGLTLSFFCAETPSTRGTAALLHRIGADWKSLRGVRYRGYGWPGQFSTLEHNESDHRPKMSYRDSWAFLQAYRPWSVQLWPDGTGELADISCGDPWYEEPDGTNPGFSLVIARTERGHEIIQRAMDAGYLTLKRAEPWKLSKSQKNLMDKKGAVWGRLMMLRLFRLPARRFRHRGLFKCWLRLSVSDKLRSTLGTARRIISRKLYQPLKLDRATAVPVKTPTMSTSPRPVAAVSN